jgi:hypothetical protein
MQKLIAEKRGHANYLVTQKRNGGLLYQMATVADLVGMLI